MKQQEHPLVSFILNVVLWVLKYKTYTTYSTNYSGIYDSIVFRIRFKPLQKSLASLL
jgi:hypothetical protein